MPPPAGPSLGTVGIAFAADLAMVAAKAVAALVTGSAALFAETLHSLADTNNQLLLLKGCQGQPATTRHQPPLRIRRRAVLLVAAGRPRRLRRRRRPVHLGRESRLLHPREVQAGLLGLAVLSLGCLLDGSSWLGSVRQLRREASARGIPFRQHLRSTTDTAVTAVFYEDAAALLGNAIALAGLGLHQLLDSPAPDAVAGIVIGLLWRPSGCGWQHEIACC